MPLFERSYNDLLAEAVDELTANTRISRVSPGSKARTILEAHSRTVNEAYQIFDLNFVRGFLSGATGRWLDLIGELLGVSRLGSSIAAASASNKVVKFYTDGGVTFGSINGGNSIVIPTGTIISTAAGDSGLKYRMPIGVVLAASGTEQYVAVEAVSTGELYNVGANQLRFHNFGNYEDTANNTLLVNNVSGITNGSSLETDPNYRFRISKSAVASEAANETSILLAALSTPGVANVVLSNRAKGIGTFKLVLKAITPTVSDTLIDSVESSISNVVGLGILPIVDRPKETGLAFDISLLYKNGVSNEERDNIEEQVRSAISNYVNNLDIGEDFVLNELVERILSVSPNIKDIGSPNKPIDAMYVYKESNLYDNRVKEELIDNYDPEDLERVIMEPSLSEPVQIARKN